MKKEHLLKCCIFCQLIFTLACVNDDQNQFDRDVYDVHEETDNTSQDTLASWSRKELKIEELRVVKDTLKFITSSKELYYPLGKFKRIEKLADKFPMLKFKEGLPNSLDVSKAVFNHSYLKFFNDEETGNLEIVYAMITDSGIKFINNIEVGINTKQFYNVFFSRPVRLEEIHIVKVESTLLGIVHYYYIKNGKLTQIEIDSDYLLDKS